MGYLPSRKDTANQIDQGGSYKRTPAPRSGSYHIAPEGFKQSPQGEQMITMSPSVSHHHSQFSVDHIETLKNSICKGLTAEELDVFIMACQKTQLDPFMRQIYAVKRKSKNQDGSWSDKMTIQTGIDGYRLIAERTGCYAPGPEPTYTYDKEGMIVSCTAYIKKQTRDRTWHTVSSSAYIEEYCQTYTDKQTGKKIPTGMWANMPRTMLAKCAEAQALRKAFPAEMSGIYTKEEMQQAEVEEIASSKQIKQSSRELIETSKEIKQISTEIKDESSPKKLLRKDQVDELLSILDNCESGYRDRVYGYLKNAYQCNTLISAPEDVYERIKTAATIKAREYQDKIVNSALTESMVNA